MDFSSDVYSRTGSSLLDSIAIVHPFIISVLIGRISEVVSHVGEVRTCMWHFMDRGSWNLRGSRNFMIRGPEISYLRESRYFIFKGSRNFLHKGSSNFIFKGVQKFHRMRVLNLCSYQNCISVMRELPLHIWTPTSADLGYAHQWLVGTPLQSDTNKLARVMIGELNWGRRTEVCTCACNCNITTTAWLDYCKITVEERL